MSRDGESLAAESERVQREACNQKSPAEVSIKTWAGDMEVLEITRPNSCAGKKKIKMI